MCMLNTRKYSPELPEVFAQKMDEYFIEENYPWTMTGLCIHLHIVKDTLWEYSKISQFTESIRLAKQRIENYAETKLFRDAGQVTGIIFNLKNNFNWTDKQEINNTNINKCEPMTLDEAEKIIAEYEAGKLKG